MKKNPQQKLIGPLQFPVRYWYIQTLKKVHKINESIFEGKIFLCNDYAQTDHKKIK